MKQTKVKHIKRVAATLLAAVLLTQPAAWAAEPDEVLQSVRDDLNYIDDIYRYDLGGFNDAEEAAEETEISKAVFTVLTLGIMEKDENGSFAADAAVPFNEFAKIIMRLSVGGSSAIEADYDAYEPRPTLTHEAAEYLVGVLGYENRTLKYSGSYPAMRVAADLGLFGKTTATAEKQVTYGELAEMIAKALKINLVQQTGYGSREEFSVTKGQTLLSERFEAIELNGIVSGVSGVDLYSDQPLDDNRIAINRVEYRTNGESYSEFLGRRVYGFACLSAYNDYEVCGLMEDDRDQSLTVRLGDVEELTSDRLVWQNAEGKSQRQSLNSIEHIVYNYSPTTRSVLNADLTAYDGTITLSASSVGSGYDVAVICAEEIFRVQHVSSMNDRIYLKDGMTFNGKDYLDADASGDSSVSLQLDGVTAKATDLKANDVISVLQNQAKTYTVLMASRKTVSGTVTAVSADTVWIDGTSYPLTRQYRTALAAQNTDIEQLKPGMVGKFNLSTSQHVAGFDGSNGISYAYMKQINRAKGLEATVAVKLFTQDGEWITPAFADKLELDGIGGVTAGEAYQTLSGMSGVFYKPVRYRLNNNGKISFLDTAHDNAEEQGDSKAIRESYTWSGELDWTGGWNLAGVSYALMSNTVIFSVPEDLDDDEDYEVIRNSSIETDTNAEIGLYSADEFYAVPVATFLSRGSGTSYFIGSQVQAVERVETVLNAKEEECVKLVGKKSVFISPGVGSWSEQELTVSQKMFKRDPSLTFKPGDVFFYLLDSKGEINKIDRILSGGKLVDGRDTSEVHDTDSEYAWGRVVGLDSEQHLIKMDVAPEGSGSAEYKVFMPRGVQFWDAARGQFISGSMEDITIGDMVLATGNVRHVCLTVFRSE